MIVRLHPHAYERAHERGATLEEIVDTVERGKRFTARFGRTGFRYTFSGRGCWQGRTYVAKHLAVVGVPERNGWLVITVIVKYLRRRGRR